MISYSFNTHEGDSRSSVSQYSFGPDGSLIVAGGREGSEDLESSKIGSTEPPERHQFH